MFGMMPQAPLLKLSEKQKDGTVDGIPSHMQHVQIVNSTCLSMRSIHQLGQIH